MFGTYKQSLTIKDTEINIKFKTEKGILKNTNHPEYSGVFWAFIFWINLPRREK